MLLEYLKYYFAIGISILLKIDQIDWAKNNIIFSFLKSLFKLVSDWIFNFQIVTYYIWNLKKKC